MPPAQPDDRVRVDGKQFSLRGRRFAFRGVTYGTFRPREDGERFPERGPAKLDFHAIAGAGFTVVRTYTAPPDDIVELAADHDLRRYLTRLHHLAGDRPLVLGEVGLDAGDDPDGERRQAETIDWQLETALERGVAGACVFSWTDEWWVGDQAVEGWRFGLTRTD